MVRKVLFVASLVVHTVGTSQAQYSINYQWLNFICGNNLNCDEGCSACDEPENSSNVFFGTTMAWIGTSVCPEPVSPANNALYSDGWSAFASEEHYGVLSGIALTTVQVDSVIITHRREDAGPQRLKISFTGSLAQPFQELGDADVLTEFNTTVFTDLGCLEIQEGMPYAAFQLKVQPYQTEGGKWHLDGIRVVASACQGTMTGIEEYQPATTLTGPYFDVLGRPVGDRPAQGVYSGPKRQIQIF